MASTASTVLRIELMNPGEQDGTWGTKTNSNFGILESALTGVTAIATTGGETTLTNADYVNDQAKKLALDVTGALVSNATIVIPNATKSYKVLNRTSGAFTLTIKTTSGVGLVITQSSGAEIYCNGSNVVRFLTPMTDFTTGAPVTASGAAASSVSVEPTGNLASVNAQAALAELQGDIDSINANLLANYIGNLAKTKGNIPVGNGSAWAALGVGLNGYALIAKSGATEGMQWSALIPQGTVSLFYQPAAPVGWTVSNADNDKALRVVSGTSGLGGAAGGTTAFSTVFAARTITQAMLPNVTLTFSGTTSDNGNHSHGINDSGSAVSSGASAGYRVADLSTGYGNTTTTDGLHSHTVSGNTASINGNVSQATFDMAVQFCSVIKASKDAY